MPKHQIFVASYARDFVWLEYLLRSIERYVVDFLPPVVVVPESDVAAAEAVSARCRSRALVRTQVGAPADASKWRRFLSAQVAMLESDLHCPDAEFIWLFGSDCFVHGMLTPSMGLGPSGRAVMPYSPYAALPIGPQCWRASTEHLIQVPSVEFEFMRRLPLVYPAELYRRTRAHVAAAFGAPFRDVVFDTERRGLKASESNVLGAYAWHFFRDAFEWVDVSVHPERDVTFPAIQFWSHGGLDLPCDQWHRYHGQTPRQFMDRFLA